MRELNNCFLKMRHFFALVLSSFVCVKCVICFQVSTFQLLAFKGIKTMRDQITPEPVMELDTKHKLICQPGFAAGMPPVMNGGIKV